MAARAGPCLSCVASPRPGTTVPGFTSCSRLTHLERKIREAFQPLANLSFRLIWSRVRQCLGCRRHSIMFRVCPRRAVGYRSRQRDEKPARQDFSREKYKPSHNLQGQERKLTQIKTLLKQQDSNIRQDLDQRNKEKQKPSYNL